jgi:hypothetical protein
MMMRLTALLACVFSLPLLAANAPAAKSQDLPLLFHEDFSDGDKALSHFEFTDPSAWKIDKDKVDGHERSVLVQTKIVMPRADIPRGPGGRAWIKDLSVGAFVMEAKIRSTVKDYPHRDMILMFAGNDPSHLMYVHIGKIADPHCNSIFLVNGKDRESVASRTTKGTDWDDNYHTVRLTRSADGKTEVFWDGTSIMTSEDKTIPAGRLGVGSFDDTGNIAEITVWGQKANLKADRK